MKALAAAVASGFVLVACGGGGSSPAAAPSASTASTAQVASVVAQHSDVKSAVDAFTDCHLVIGDCIDKATAVITKMTPLATDLKSVRDLQGIPDEVKGLFNQTLNAIMSMLDAANAYNSVKCGFPASEACVRKFSGMQTAAMELGSALDGWQPYL